MVTMNVTEHTIATITQGLRKNNMTQTELAEKMGFGKAWVSKLLKGGIKNLSDEHTDQLEEVLNVSFFTLVETNQVPGLAVELGQQMKDRPELTELVAALLSLNNSTFYTVPHIPTKDLVDFGKEIVRASHEDPDKPGKVGRIAITWLSERLNKLKSK